MVTIWAEGLRRGIGEVDRVLLGQHQRVAAGERADVEDAQIGVVLVDPDSRSLSGDDRAENAGHPATVLVQPPAGYAAAVDPSEIAFAGAAAQAQMLADGEITAPQLLEVYLERSSLDCELRATTAWCSTRRTQGGGAAQTVLDAGSGCRCSACRSRSKTMSTSPAR